MRNVDARLVMLDAFSQAERRAAQHPETHACVYAKVEGPDKMAWFVRLATEAAPEGAALMGTVSRKPPHDGLPIHSLASAANHVLLNLPAGVELSSEAIVEYYPERRNWLGEREPRRVFAYQFMSTAGRNIATWIPDVAVHGVTMQTGFDGRGREYHDASAKPTEALDLPQPAVVKRPATAMRP